MIQQCSKSLVIALFACVAAAAQDASSVEARYAKREYRIPMRDGAHLFTTVYTPRDDSRAYPMLMKRTPYSVRPYGEDAFPSSLGPSKVLEERGYIFVYQDVRGRYMSEGTFVNVTPHVTHKRGAADIDESTDGHDTIAWLLENVPGHNGRVGMWGISYSGFYAAASMIDAHPALKAVSPQAPVADWWYDDFHHHGAFFLAHAFNFMSWFGRPRTGPTTERNPRFQHPTPDGYRFFLDLGPLHNADARYFKGGVPFWNAFRDHPNYDAFWHQRDILPHLNRTAPAVMTVGGWFDAEDLYGPLSIYRSIEAKNPDVFNVLVIGPWWHGGWARDDGDHLGNVHFGSATARFYREHIEARFFEHFLADADEPGLPEAFVFETGANRWRRFDAWPPTSAHASRLYLRGGGVLSAESSSADDGFDAFVSDPAKPVPYTETVTTGMTREFMSDDQRFAATRPDVLTYRTAVLDEDLTMAGPLLAELFVSTSESAADWVVKLIDEFPPDAADHEFLERNRRMGGYMMMVRSEVIRGRFRNGHETPEPFVPDEIARVPLPLQDVLHTFRKGHRIVVQIQSTWFPLVDRNPQRFVPNIFDANESDFVKATHRVHRTRTHPTRLEFSIVPG